MKTPLFTVIIPTLNEEHYLPDLLEDLAKQEEKDFEVVVVDGKSEDRTVAIAEKFSGRIDLKAVVSPEANLSVQRNLGARTARGTYYIFLDADTRIDPDFIKVFKTTVEKSRFMIIFPMLVPNKGTRLDRFFFGLATRLVEISQHFNRPIPTGSAYAFLGQYFHFLGGFTEKRLNTAFFPEDQDIMLRAALNGVHAQCLRNVKAYFSLRRIEKEGRFRIYWEYILAGLDTTFRGRVSVRPFKYEMGGHVYRSNQVPAEHAPKA